MIEDRAQRPAAGGHRHARRQVTWTAVAGQDLQSGAQPLVGAGAVPHPADGVVLCRLPVDAHRNGERKLGEQPGVGRAHRGEVGGEGEPHGPAGGGRRSGGVPRRGVQQPAGQQRFPSHESEHEVGSGRGLGDEPVHRGGRHVRRHCPSRSPEAALVGVAVSARHVAGLHNVERDGRQRRGIQRAAVDPPGWMLLRRGGWEQPDHLGQGSLIGVFQRGPAGQPALHPVGKLARHVVHPAAVHDEQVCALRAAEHSQLGVRSWWCCRLRRGGWTGAPADLQQHRHVPASILRRSCWVHPTSRSYWRRVRCSGYRSEPRIIAGIRRS